MGGTPWTGLQSDTGLTKRNRQPFTSNGNFKLPKRQKNETKAKQNKKGAT